ncbi:uncharacterized protein KGF55_003081 [Candida pseudojiufengensis]|uniref:uncharacterized protein n=1 Tax=Candida pseudojiufengensis TaxID=497109 RepID=UPI0022243B0D|nr:uncharacterized protein KGF55_003081 [Candida pseudojiufengensis]KAI5963289.1 hypothetical protein KGF55_003081 [Candida pseudojiufengensis]
MALKIKLKAPSESSSTPQPTSIENGSKIPKIKIKAPQPQPQQEQQQDQLPHQSLQRKRHNTDTLNENEKPKKLKLSLSKNQNKQNQTNKPRIIPRVRIKPTRVPGEGYDSEAPDLEDDPLIEQGIIIRFLDDANLDFVHTAIDSGDLTGLNVKWITREKAVVNVNGNLYSARLIDLPTVTEIYKTIDKKNIFKNFDVCQILLVLHIINPAQLNTEKDFEVPEEYLFNHPFYKHVKNNEIKKKKFVLRDGLLNPFKDVYRRFRPTRVDHRVIEDIEASVDSLIKLDNEAEESHFEILDKSSQPRLGRASEVSTPINYEQRPVKQEFKRDSVELENEAPGEPDAGEAEDFELNLEEELNKVFDDEGETEEPVVTVPSSIAEALNNDEAEIVVDEGLENGDIDDLFGDYGEDAEEEEEIHEGEEQEEEEEEEEEDDDEEEDEEDEEEDEDTAQNKAGLSHTKLLQEEISELEKVVETHKKNLASATNKMTKMKYQNTISSLSASLDQKKKELDKSQELHTKNAEIKPNDAFDEDADDEDNEDEELQDDDANDDIDDLF